MKEHVGNSIPHSVFDTRGLPGRRAFNLWQEHKSRHYDLRAPKHYPQVFDMRADFWNLGNIVIADLQVPAQEYRRSRACIGRDGMDLFAVQLYRKGWNGPRDSGATARAGDIVIFDMAQPIDRSGGDNETVILFLPRSLLSPHLKAPDEHSQHLLTSSDPLAALLRDHMISLHAQIADMSLDQAKAVVPATVQLTAAALNGTVQEEQAAGIRVALTERICSYIRDHIVDPDLNPEAIAGRFQMTRRNLGYLFESHGGVAAYIRRERLSRIRAILSHPAHKGQSIESIAEAYGFNHYRSFALAFQRQFGFTPREMRMRALEGKALSATSRNNLADWIHWLELVK